MIKTGNISAHDIDSTKIKKNNRKQGEMHMDCTIKPKVTGVEEVIELLKLADEQAVKLQETLDKISQSTININVEVVPSEVYNNMKNIE